ncbi:hypothetical protein R5W23_000713, partial [Gemmata sp. JC673]
ALALGKAVLARADTSRGRYPNGCRAGYELTELKKQSHRFWIMAGRYETETTPQSGATQADGLTCRWGLDGHLLISRGSVSVGRGCIRSFIIATGDFDCPGNETYAMHDSVIVCDGDMRIGGSVGTSVLIARGSISIKGETRASTLVAGGTVTVGKLPRPPRPDVPEDRYDRVEIEEKARAPLAFITFFELSTVGVEVKTVNKVV